MRSLFIRRRAITGALLVFAVVVVGLIAANAVLRPGCSLLPVALPDDPSGANTPATPEQSCAALGRPLPQAGALPPSVERGRVFVNSAPSFGGPRFVTVSYTRDGEGVALLQVVRGNAIPVGNAGEVNGAVSGAPAVINQRPLPQAAADDVSYLWSRDGLLFTLHVRLAPGITREAADAMAASIR